MKKKLLNLLLTLSLATSALASTALASPERPSATLPDKPADVQLPAFSTPDQGIQSISGSVIAFDQSGGGDSCYNEGASQTFCFWAESFTDDEAWAQDQFFLFPSDWQITNAYDNGPTTCDGGGSFGPFDWLPISGNYEIQVDHDRFHLFTDHCYTYVCFDVVAGAYAPTGADVSWYWDSDEYGDPPHHPCSDDGYTPSGLPACDEMIYPVTNIPACQPGLYLTPDTLQAEGCAGISQTHSLNLFNETGSAGTFNLNYSVPGGNASLTGPASLTLNDGADQDFDITLTPNDCLPDGTQITATVQADGNGISDTTYITKTVIDVSGWISIPTSAPTWAGNGHPGDGCTAQDAAGNWVTYLIGDQNAITGFWGYNHATNTWFNPGATNTPAARWEPDWAYDPESNLCYLTGGAAAPGPATYNEAYVYDPVTNAFTQLPNFNTARNWHDSWVGQIDGTKYLCIGGGVNSGGTFMASTQCYDIVGGTWQTQNSVMGAYPVTIWGAADGVRSPLTGDQFWVVAGTQDGAASDMARYFDDADNAWHTAGNTGQIRFQVEGEFKGHDFYQIGGTADGATPSPTVVRGRLQGTNWVWKQLEDLPNARLDNVVGVTSPAAGATPDAIWSIDGYGDNNSAYVDYLTQCPACSLNWSKQIDGQAWTPGFTLTSETSSTLQIVDTITTYGEFNLRDSWDPDRLALLSYQANNGSVTTGADALTWTVSAGASENNVLTKTFQLQPCTWTETLLLSQLTPQSSPYQERPIQINKRQPELWIDSTYPDHVYPGQPATFTLIYSNTGGYEDNISIHNTFPITAPYASAVPPADWVAPDGTAAQWIIHYLGSGDWDTIDVVVDIDPSLTPSTTIEIWDGIYNHVDQLMDQTWITLHVTESDCIDLTDITILGDTYGYPDTYVFSTEYSPPGATQPIGYLWDDGGTAYTSTRNLDVGVHTLVVTATNCLDALVTDTHTITIEQPCQPVTGVDLTLVTTGTIYPGDQADFAADIVPDDATKPYTYQITIDGAPGAVLSSSADPFTFDHTFNTTGTHTVQFAAWNCDMTEPVTDALEVEVYQPGTCVDLTDITILGDTYGYPDTYVFDTEYSPAGASSPISYLWDDGGTNATSSRNLGVGVHTLVVTATNCTDALVTDIHTITIEQPCLLVTSVDLTLVTTGTIYPGDPIDFEADIVPDDFTAPYSYTLSDDSGVVDSGTSDNDPFTFEFTYNTTGTYTVQFAAWNCDMTEPVTDAVQVEVYQPGTCVDLTDITILGDTYGYPDTYVFGTEYSPAGASSPISYLWDDGGTNATSSRNLGVGVHTLVVTATNCTDALVTDTHTITIEPAPVCTQVTGVDLTLTPAGTIYTDTLVQFEGDVMPDDATKPYSYTVDYGDGSAPVVGASSDDPYPFSHTYPNTGTYTAQFWAWNCDMTVPMTDSLTFTVYPVGQCVEVSGVDLSLLTMGTISPGDLVNFRANISPDGASLPYTYTIDYGDGSGPITDASSADPFDFNHTYANTGTYTVQFAAWNCDMTQPFSDSLQVTIDSPTYDVYLPIVIRGS